MMRRTLTIVLRFVKHEDLSIQLNELALPQRDEVEILCIGYGTKANYEKALKGAASTLDDSANLNFAHVKGDHATARTEAISAASGDYLLFPNVNYIYNWDKVLASSASSPSDCESIVLRAQNRKMLPKNADFSTSDPIKISFDSGGKNYFQGFGCSLAYTLLSKAKAEKIIANPYCKTCHDNAFSVAVACEIEKAIIVGRDFDAITKCNREKGTRKPSYRYYVSSISDSVELLIEIRNLVRRKEIPSLLDSFQRIFSSRIRTYLIQNNQYEYREKVLSILSVDDDAVSFFALGDKPKWNKTAKRNFEFVKWAIKTFIKLCDIRSYGEVLTETVVESSASDPEISVVIPVYNTEKFVAQTVQSVLDQTYGDFEIICIDDGSTDNSLSVLKSLAEIDSRISVYSQPNMGLSETRNNGIKLARGKFIFFLDSDDMIENALFEIAIDEIKRGQLDMFLFDATTFYDSDELAKDHDSFDNYYARESSYKGICTGIEMIGKMWAKKEYRTSACMYLANLNVIRSFNIRFLPGILHEDNAFTFILMSNMKRVLHLNEPLYLRRVHGGSIMTSNKTFDNAYGYFKCAQDVLAKCYYQQREKDDLVSSLATAVSFSMMRNAQKDLLSAEDGQDGGAYALDDGSFRLFSLNVKDIVIQKRIMQKMLSKEESLSIKLAKDAEKKSDCTTNSIPAPTRQHKPKLSRILHRTK